MSEPRLRTVNKVQPPYRLGLFKRESIISIAGGIVYLLHTRNEARLEGPDWEKIFAESIGAEWKPSNIGLDDVQFGCCCWGAKTVKNRYPSTAKSVRLISGRNSLDYSYGKSDVRSLPPQSVGSDVIEIWNERVSSVRERFAHVRTVVLLKSSDLSECALFEVDTVRFDPTLFDWTWNRRGNLEGRELKTKRHRFTWQPHGSQFTIIEDVPANRVAFRIRLPGALSKDVVLGAIGFDDTWVEFIDAVR